MFHAFLIQNDLKEADILLTLFLNFSFQYSVRKCQKNQEAQELNGTHQLLIHTDDVNVLGENINTMKENRSSDVRREVGLEVNAEKIKYSLCLCLVTRMQDNHNLMIASRSF
jgi:hypothetical protein